MIGDNGCGKTTLLSIVAGYCNYEEGSCKLFGSEQKESNLEEIRKKVGLISDSYFSKQYRQESVSSVILSGKSGSFSVRPGVTNRDLILMEKMLKSCGLVGRADSAFCTLSKGEQQSTILARALFADPEILLLDEAESGLDLIARLHLQDILNELANKKNMTMISVTHYPNEISDLFQQCLLLKYGKTFKKGNVSDVFSSSVMSEYFEQDVIVEKATIGYQVTQAKSYRGMQTI